MPDLVAAALLAWGRAPDPMAAAVLTGLGGLGLRSGLRLFLDRGREWPVVAGRLLTEVLALAASAAFLPIGLATIGRSRAVLWTAGVTAILVPLSALLPGRRSTNVAAFVPLALAAAIVLVAGLVLLPAGFLRASPGEPVVLVELTGESRREVVRWAPNGLPLREEGLRAHRLRLLRPDGAPVGEAWLLGSGATLIAQGQGASLLRPLTVRNDAPTGDGEARLYPPHTAMVAPLGPLDLPAWWRGGQERLLDGIGLERREAVSSPLPLVDGQGLALRTTYRLAPADDGSLAPAP
jgi:hypothetical protein